MQSTKYHRATDIVGATALLASAKDGMLLAGGQTLIPTMKARLATPTDLIDISHVEGMSGIKITDGAVKIGAMTTHAKVASDIGLARLCPAICELAANIGDPAVRNLGTLGGSLANNDPAADYPAAVLALDATIITNSRTIAASEFFDGMFTTSLDEGEIITEVEFDAPERAAYAKFPNPASRYALCGVFVADGPLGTRVAITGAGSDGVYRHKAMEDALSVSWAAEVLDAIAIAEDDMLEDIHGDPKYRANLVRVMAKRAVSAAQAR